jgi:hypothetical protein
MKERNIVIGATILLASAVLVATWNTDLIYIVAGILFFIVCIAYAEWCERL